MRRTCAAGTKPLPYPMHTCGRCGYSGAERDFAEPAEVTPALREHVWNELAPVVCTTSMTGSEKYEAALDAWDGVAREERAVVTYLVGELWRRVGDAKLAREWFTRVRGEIVDQSTQQWVLDAARQQRGRPREWFGYG